MIVKTHKNEEGSNEDTVSESWEQREGDIKLVGKVLDIRYSRFNGQKIPQRISLLSKYRKYLANIRCQQRL